MKELIERINALHKVEEPEEEKEVENRENCYILFDGDMLIEMKSIKTVLNTYGLATIKTSDGTTLNTKKSYTEMVDILKEYGVITHIVDARGRK